MDWIQRRLPAERGGLGQIGGTSYLKEDRAYRCVDYRIASSGQCRSAFWTQHCYSQAEVYVTKSATKRTTSPVIEREHSVSHHNHDRSHLSIA